MHLRFPLQNANCDFIFPASGDPRLKNSGEGTVTFELGRTYQNHGIVASQAGVQHMNDAVAR
jgi:hypothetical protein